MKIINTGKIPVKMWLENVEGAAMEQIKNLADLPFAFHHVAIMPDAHCGYGMPIGGVLATKGVVIPNAVGVDIGCGMSAVKTSIRADEIEKEELKKIMGLIRDVVPVGFNHHAQKQDEDLMPTGIGADGSSLVFHLEYYRALYQLGTLGGGNHFIEFQKDNEGYVWVMIHSGSRNLGKRVADHYNRIAVELNERYFHFLVVPKEWQLAFLPVDAQEGIDYMIEMNYCVNFALANRDLMMTRIIEVMQDILPQFSVDPMFNIAHNYAAIEHHFGSDVMIHRKGATLAREGTIGIIPGSQGTKSYIVRGKGNADSFTSCSHGAGRVMGRKEAQRKLSLEEEIKKLDDQNIVHSVRSVEDLDEASGAYKSIDEVMHNQADLVDIVYELSPIAVIKA